MDQDDIKDSMATVTIKESYPPSESYSSEPPPVRIYEAYQKPKSSAVQIARIAALTVIACCVILGSFILAAAWISSTASCQYMQTIQDEADNPSFQQLVDPLQSDETKEHRKEAVDDSNEVNSTPFQFKLPLTLDFDEMAGSLMERNQRARMNCVVEKRRSDEVVDHQPKTVRLPFGVNLTTDPRLEHISGEKMMIFCESGNDQRHVPMHEMMPPPVVVHHMPPPQPAKAASSQEVPHLQLLQHILQQQQQQQQQQHQQKQQQQEMPTLIHTTIHVGEERSVPIEGRQGRAFHHPVPVPVQIIEERSERMEGRQGGRAFLHPVQIPFQVAEESRRGRAFPHPIALPFQVAEEQRMEGGGGRQGRNFPGVQITEARVYQHPVEVAEARAFHAHIAPEQALFPRLPVHAPAPVQPDQPRPHYVQPRSVRSVDEVLHRREKRVRRCACNCDC